MGERTTDRSGVGGKSVLTMLGLNSVEYCAVLLAVLDQPGPEHRRDGLPPFLGDENAVIPQLVIDADGVLPDAAASFPWGHALRVGSAGVGVQLTRCLGHPVSVPSCLGTAQAVARIERRLGDERSSPRHPGQEVEDRP